MSDKILSEPKVDSQLAGSMSNFEKDLTGWLPTIYNITERDKKLISMGFNRAVIFGAQKGWIKRH
jgi:hypothetical protein